MNSGENNGENVYETYILYEENMKFHQINCLFQSMKI